MFPGLREGLRLPCRGELRKRRTVTPKADSVLEHTVACTAVTWATLYGETSQERKQSCWVQQSAACFGMCIIPRGRYLTFSHLATVPSVMDGDSCGIGTRTAMFSIDLSELTNLFPVERASTAFSVGACSFRSAFILVKR